MPIVETFITAHAPGITGYPEAAEESARREVLDAFKELGDRVQELNPDIIVGVSNDHFTAFFDPMAPFCIGLSPRFQGPNPDFEPIMGLPCREYKGHSGYAKALLDKAYDLDFDLAYSREKLMFEDQFPVPLNFIDPSGKIPLVPIFVNCLLKPLPRLRRCFDLGRVIAQTATDRPERILVLATGGLSHWVGTVEEGQINSAFEKKVIDALRRGDVETLIALEEDEIEAAGNGAHEIRNWLVACGANQGSSLELVIHREVPEWQTGIVIGRIR